MYPNEVFSGGELGKEYNVPDLPNDKARARLVELRFDDQTRIARLRIDGPGRLYGFRQDRFFFALWWDPHHEIWPSQKRNT